MISISDFRREIVQPVLKGLEPSILYSIAAENLIIGTFLHESWNFYNLKQVGGPALGFGGMEPATFDDILKNFVSGRPELHAALTRAVFGGDLVSDRLLGDMRLMVAMARIQYFRHPQALPPANDALGMAELYKAVYNTAGGAATVADVLSAFQQAIAA